MRQNISKNTIVFFFDKYSWVCGLPQSTSIYLVRLPWGKGTFPLLLGTEYR